MKKRFKVLFIIALILTVGLLTACGQTGEANESTEEAMVTEATEAMEETAMPEESMTLSANLTLDPAIASLDDKDTLTISGYVYEGLMRKLANGDIVPGIATACDEAEDGLSYVCTLRSDAVFSDGTPITADVVLDNFNRWYDPSHPLHGDSNDVYQGWIEYFKGFKDEVDENGEKISLFDGIEKVNDQTVLIHLFQPMSDFLEILASPHFSILNPATLEAHGASYGTMVGSVVSSGPYLVSDWTDTSLTLTPNGDYWGEMPTEDLVYTFE